MYVRRRRPPPGIPNHLNETDGHDWMRLFPDGMTVSTSWNDAHNGKLAGQWNEWGRVTGKGRGEWAGDPLGEHGRGGGGVNPLPGEGRGRGIVPVGRGAGGGRGAGRAQPVYGGGGGMNAPPPEADFGGGGLGGPGGGAPPAWDGD